jgi:hypothetical protein
VIAVLREIHGMTGHGEFVLPAVDSVRRPMSNNTLNAALRRLGYSKEEVSVSGFRATASTLLNETGRWNPDAIERQLAHMEENDVRRAYMHAAEFWDERVQMMQVWADYLDQLRYVTSSIQRVQPLPRGKNTASEGFDWLKRVIEPMERRVNEEKNDGDPPWAHHIPHEDAARLIEGAKRYLSGEAKSLESACGMKSRGRPVNSYKPKNLELAEKVLGLKEQGMTLEDIVQELYGHRSNPPSPRYVQTLIKRFTPAIKDKQRKAIVNELRQRQLARSKTPPRLASRHGRNRVEAIWVDATRELTPEDLKNVLRRQVTPGIKRHNSE